MAVASSELGRVARSTYWTCARGVGPGVPASRRKSSRESRVAATSTLQRRHDALSTGWTARLCVEVVPDAPHFARLDRHVREIRLARAIANFDAMHSRLEVERRDRRRRAVVLAIDVELASGRYREDQPRRAAGLRGRDFRLR